MKKPKIYRVGVFGSPHTVEYKPDVEVGFEESIGSFDLKTRKVEVNSTQDAHGQASTAIHELVHAYYAGLQGTDGDDEQEERIVTRITSAIVDFLGNNKVLAKRIFLDIYR